MIQLQLISLTAPVSKEVVFLNFTTNLWLVVLIDVLSVKKIPIGIVAIVTVLINTV